ncbi:MAG: hypothetical protein K0Q49_347 [Haloplasmataceae bacterium]|jgi:hypothetical protein|nr:hypothetical protein [Haloplasmataceae bacterium]
MSYILLILGLIISLLGLYNFIISLLFIKSSHIIEGVVVNRELKDSDECFIVNFNFENIEYQYCCEGSDCANIGDKVLIRLVKKGNKLQYKLNKITVIFTDSLILLPIGLLLIISGLIF